MAKVYLRSINKVKDLPENTIKLFIARKPIKNMEKYSFKHELKLAPSSKLLNQYISKKITWDEYENQFSKELLYMQSTLNKIKLFIDKDINIALICYCGDFMKCHRRLIGEKLIKMGLIVEMG